MTSRPLPLEQLIGAPLRALVLGQGIAAQATAAFISEVGFNPRPGPGGEPSVRTLEFTYIHPVPDPANPGGIINTPVRVSVPLLTVVSMPNVAIAEATVTFGANVVDLKAIGEKPSEVIVERPAPSALPPAVQTLAVYAAPPTPGAPGFATLSFTIKVAREPLGEGLTRVLSLLQDAITSLAVKG